MEADSEQGHASAQVGQRPCKSVQVEHRILIRISLARMVTIEEYIVPTSVRETSLAAPPPHDPVSAFADDGVNCARLADWGEVAWC